MIQAKKNRRERIDLKAVEARLDEVDIKIYLHEI